MSWVQGKKRKGISANQRCSGSVRNMTRYMNRYIDIYIDFAGILFLLAERSME